MPYMIEFQGCGCLIDIDKCVFKKTSHRGKRVFFCPEHNTAREKNWFKCEQCGKLEDRTLKGEPLGNIINSKKKLCAQCNKEGKIAVIKKWHKMNRDRKKQWGERTIGIDQRKRDKVITRSDCKFYLSYCLPKAAFDTKKSKYVKCNGCKRYAPVESNMAEHVKCNYDMLSDNIYIFGDM